ncbi:MAG: hypothetical protein ACLSVD_15525 [Eggerthellaceae bacterium]
MSFELTRSGYSSRVICAWDSLARQVETALDRHRRRVESALETRGRCAGKRGAFRWICAIGA